MIVRTASKTLAIAAVALLVITSCSSDDEASTCEDLQNLADELRGLQEVDLVQTGLSGLEDQTDSIDEAWNAARESGEEQFGSELDSLETAITSLGSTLSGAEDGGESITDVLGQVETDVEQIAASWSDLTSAVDTELGDCDLDASTS